MSLGKKAKVLLSQALGAARGRSIVSTQINTVKHCDLHYNLTIIFTTTCTIQDRHQLHSQ